MRRSVRESQIIYREAHRLKSAVFMVAAGVTLFVAYSLSHDKDKSVAFLSFLLGCALALRALWLLLSAKTLIIDRAQSYLLSFEGRPLRSSRRLTIPLEAVEVVMETRKHTAAGGKSGPIVRVRGRIILVVQGEEPIVFASETFAANLLRPEAEKLATDLGRRLRFSEHSEG